MTNTFNPSPSAFMHIDLNSCFATIEQQANPLLRGKPIAVAAYPTPRGCILAPSIEAKRYGIKTGMRVMEGKALYKNLIILSPDPPKYRFINQKLQQLFGQYSPLQSVRSIDEVLLDFSGTPAIRQMTIAEIGREIKTRIKKEIGDWLTVSIGISTNPYLSKLAAGLHKPDGLDEINSTNILAVLAQMKLVDLPYIKERNALRLTIAGIYTPVDFYFADRFTLKSAFQSINGHYWFLRLHGFLVDNGQWQRKSVGHSYALPQPTNNINKLEVLLCKLVEKMGTRLRRNNYTAQGIHLACGFADGSYWHHGQKFPEKMYAGRELFRAAASLLHSISPLKPVTTLAVSSYCLEQNLYGQLNFFENEEKKKLLTQAVDKINNVWGEFTIKPGTMMHLGENEILDRISFGSVRDMTRVV